MQFSGAQWLLRLGKKNNQQPPGSLRDPLSNSKMAETPEEFRPLCVHPNTHVHIYREGQGSGERTHKHGPLVTACSRSVYYKQ